MHRVLTVKKHTLSGIRHVHKQTWQYDRKTPDVQGHAGGREDCGVSQRKQHKGNRNRSRLQKTGELVEEGVWINKTVPSASPGPVGSVKWVDMGRWVSPFFSFLLSSLPFLPLSFSSIWQIPPLPLPLPCCTLHWNGLSPTHKPTLACTSIPHLLSHVLFTVQLQPTALQDGCHSPPPLCFVPRCCTYN